MYSLHMRVLGILFLYEILQDSYKNPAASILIRFLFCSYNKYCKTLTRILKRLFL